MLTKEAYLQAASHNTICLSNSRENKGLSVCLWGWFTKKISLQMESEKPELRLLKRISVLTKTEQEMENNDNKNCIYYFL